MVENWKDVVGYEGYYEISSIGRVRGLPAPGRRKRGATILKQSLTGVYWKVVLSKNSKTRNKYIHRMILESFHGPCPNGLVSCHNDGNPNNNTVENLRWDTRSNNNFDKVKHGTMIIGEDHHASKLQSVDIQFIRHWIKSGFTYKEIAKPFGVCPQTICNINLGRTWSHCS